MTLLRVGADKEFLTIAGAFNSASSGDTIFIDEGLYEEVLYFVDKAVNLVANTDYPSEGKVIVKPVSYSTAAVRRYDLPLTILYASSEPSATMYIEGIKFVSAASGYETTLIRFKQIESDATSSLDVVFNKCILDASSGLYTTGTVFSKDLATGYSINSIRLTNCKVLWTEDDAMINDEFQLIPTKYLNKCILSDHPPSAVFGSGPDLCVGGTVTASEGGNTSHNHVDDSLLSYTTISQDAWNGYQFTSPVVINQFRVHGMDGVYAYNGSGFTLKASTTGVFSGEEVTLYHDTGGQGYEWETYNFENYVEYSYIRIYHTGTYWIWKLAEMECKFAELGGEDYTLIDSGYDFQYGPEYDSFITAIPPSHCFSGTVSVNDIPAERDLKIFRRDNGLFLDTVTSSGTGEYYFESSFGGYHNIVCVDDLALPNYNDLLMSKCLPKELPNLYDPVEHTSSQLRTIIIDMADNWSGLSYITIRSVELMFKGAILPLVDGSNCTAYSTTFYSGSYYAKYAFNTSTSKTGTWPNNGWISQNSLRTNQRLICTLNDVISIDAIKINNGHSSGGEASCLTGTKNTKIYISTSSYTDTTYDAVIPDGLMVFDGTIPAHIAEDIEDPFEINLNP